MPASSTGSDGSASPAADEKPAGSDDDRAARPGLDLPALAEKVFELLKRELRIERERQGRKQSR